MVHMPSVVIFLILGLWRPAQGFITSNDPAIIIAEGSFTGATAACDRADILSQCITAGFTAALRVDGVTNSKLKTILQYLGNK